ncbi:protein C19orf12 homolog [Neocloeon triangulifer]|uniref:protein C19orf12 homolog n=1 Tax=Neocloeon triangulifer TaxID=2078957 RepID=UPI00286F0462|nr:protein C19orf12 homolog [Neocloeon triangulifer]
MPVNRDVLMDALATVARSRNVMVTAQQSAKAGVIAGTSVLVGTLFGGPVGLVLGGIVGTTLAYKSTGPVKPLWQVLNEDFSDYQKEQLMQKVAEAFRGVEFTDIAMLATLIIRTSSLQDTAMRIALDYARSQITM